MPEIAADHLLYRFLRACLSYRLGVCLSVVTLRSPIKPVNQMFTTGSYKIEFIVTKFRGARGGIPLEREHQKRLLILPVWARLA